MSTGEQQQAPAAQTTQQETSFLDQILNNMPSTVERDRAKEMVNTLVEEALAGVVTWDKSFTKTVNRAIEQLDKVLSKQLAAIMHAPKLQKLEGTWRGLNHLVMNSETSAQLKLKMLNVSKKELFNDLDRAIEFDQSQAFKKLYEYEFGMPGGEPYGALVGDYEFNNHPDDIALMSKMSQVAAASFCPFLTAASPALFGFESYTELSKPRDIEKIFLAKEYIKWNAFRDTEDSRFVVLTMPRVLSRLPYGEATKPIDEFKFEEVELDERGRHKPVSHEKYTWMNAAYVMGARLTDAFAKFGWCTAIRGVENGGKVEGLPAHLFVTDEGDTDLKCPTEIAIGDRREAELSKQGFLPLCHFKNTDYSVFFGAQTAQKPKKYDRDDATANAAISARLPYIMAVSRIAHFLKCIARDKIGSFMERQDMEDFLKRWISNYVLLDEKPTPEMKAKFPLAGAEIEVKEVAGAPGSYNAVAWLRPWLQLEELTASLRLVASLPKKA
ncbi:MAG: type VI secretion system contractile sheath large subunit [Planctomycetes bacterium]|nr:type VI secretion system contractile sheath large subunit [Planctomycetota bacterium]